MADNHGLPAPLTGDSPDRSTEPGEPQMPQASQFNPALEATNPELLDQPEHIQIVTPNSGDSARATEEKPLLTGSDLHSTFPRSQENPYTGFALDTQIPPPPPARSRDGHPRSASRRATVLSQQPQNTPGLDWIVPVESKEHTPLTVGQRLQPTIDTAARERDKYARKAMLSGYALNVAIGLQVLLGALTTGLSAAVTSGVAISVLGGLSTLVASYLARTRGSGEPELSITRVKDLDQFLRECRAFQMDQGHEFGTDKNGLNHRIDEFRRRFEELLGNASGERKLSPLV